MVATILSVILCYFFAISGFSNEICTIACNGTHLEQINRRIEDALKVFDVPGVAVGVVVDEKVVFTKGFGYCDQKHTFNVTHKTLFPIMSCTKAFTAFVIGQLVDEGKLHWDDLISKYLPSFHLWDEERTQNITIRDLLTHRSGLPRHDVIWYTSKPGRNDSEEDVATFLKRLQYLEPICPLKEKYNYNNIMYCVLGLIVEKVTGKSWETSVEERIFSQLKMKNSHCLNEKTYYSPPFPQPHSERKGKHVPISFVDISPIRAAGAIYSNIEDMTKWIQMHLAGGNYLGKQLISKETFREMQTLQIPHTPLTNGPEIAFGYGLGWHVGKYRENDFLDHSGIMDGFFSNVALLPKQKIGVVVLTNSSFFHTLFPCAITNAIFDIFLEKMDIDWIANNKQKWHSLKLCEYEKRKEKETKRQLATVPSHPLDDFVGNYEHPGYGTIRIFLQNQMLYVHYYRLTAPLNHWENDTFEVSNEAEDPIIAGRNFSFIQNEFGKIHELQAHLELSLPPIKFERQD